MSPSDWMAKYWITQEHLQVWWHTVRQDRVTRYLILPSFLVIFIGGAVVLQQTVQGNQELRIKDEAAVALAAENAARIAELEWQVKEIESVGSGLRQLEAEFQALAKTRSPRTPTADVARLQQLINELRKRQTTLEHRMLEVTRVP